MWIDLVFAIVAAAAFFWGYSRGIIRTVISVVAIFVGFILAVRFSRPTTEILADVFDTTPDGAMPLMGFIVAFVLVLVALRLVATMLEKTLTAVRINFINKIAGGLAMAIIGTLVFSILLMFANSANLIPLDAKAKSVTYNSLEEFPGQAYAVLGKAKPAFENVRDAGKEALNGETLGN